MSSKADNMKALVGQLIASIALLIAVTKCNNNWQCDDDNKPENFGYTVSAAVVALGFSLGGLIMVHLNKEGFDKKMMGVCSSGRLLMVFLFCWWAVAAGIITFDGPFEMVGNGYFATWFGFIFAVQGLGSTATDTMKELTTIGLLGLIATSVVLVGEIAPDHIDSGDDYRDESIYAMTIALLSILVGLIFLIMQKMTGDENVCNKVKVPVFIFFVVAWMILANLVTFRGPFEIPGNGYFAAWGGVVITIYIAFSSFKVQLGEEGNAAVRAPAKSASKPEEAETSAA